MTLKVINEDGSAETTAAITVTPRRNWKTTFEQAGLGYGLGDETLVPCTFGGDCFLGRNVCVKELLPDTRDRNYKERPDSRDRNFKNHWIHTSTPGKGTERPSWRNEIKSDEGHGGPFLGWSYLTRADLLITRRPFVSSILKFGLGSWNKTPALRAALNTLIASTEAHEIAHGTLAQRALAEKDPATQLEALVVPPGADIVEAADNILRAADADLGWASRDEKVAEELWKQERFRGGGSVRFNRDAEPTPFDSFAKVGAEASR